MAEFTPEEFLKVMNEANSRIEKAKKYAPFREEAIRAEQDKVILRLLEVIELQTVTISVLQDAVTNIKDTVRGLDNDVTNLDVARALNMAKVQNVEVEIVNLKTRLSALETKP